MVEVDGGFICHPDCGKSGSAGPASAPGIDPNAVAEAQVPGAKRKEQRKHGKKR